MSKDAFWALIQEAKTACGQDLNAMEDYLREQLVSMGPAAAKNFHDILQTYEDLADQYGLWDAVSVIKEYGCSDDGFMDFRAWLIAQGKDIYMAALENPDSLTRVEQYGDCEFELLNYVGDYAYQELTGRSAYVDCTPEMEKRVLEEISGEIKYHPLIEYPLQPPDVAAVYPEIGDMIMKKYSIRFFSKDSSLWNTSLPELKAMIEKGAAEVRKLKKAKQKNKDKPRKRDDPSR